jgi:ATP-binding cassette subfamily B (MDR/TAP) protein 1
MGIVFGQLVDDMNGAACEVKVAMSADEFQPSINEKVLLLVYLSIACFVLIYLYLVSWSLVSQRLAHRLRQRYFESLLRQDATFFDTRKAGEVSSRLSSDIQTVQSGTSEKVGVCIASTSFFLTAYIVGFIKDAQLAGILVSLVPAFLILGSIGAVYIQKFSGTMSDSLATASSVASEALTHVSVVQAFGAAPRLEKKFAQGIEAAEKAGIKKAIAAAAQAGALYFIAFSANALAFWLGSRKIADALSGKGGHTTVGTIYTVVFIIVDGKYPTPLRLCPKICAAVI